MPSLPNNAKKTLLKALLVYFMTALTRFKDSRRANEAVLHLLSTKLLALFMPYFPIMLATVVDLDGPLNLYGKIFRNMAQFILQVLSKVISAMKTLKSLSRRSIYSFWKLHFDFPVLWILLSRCPRLLPQLPCYKLILYIKCRLSVFTVERVQYLCTCCFLLLVFVCATITPIRPSKLCFRLMMYVAFRWKPSFNLTRPGSLQVWHLNFCARTVLLSR